MIKTVLGEIENDSTGITLVHEHICCYNEAVYRMMGREYLDKEELLRASVSYLKQIKERLLKDGTIQRMGVLTHG